MKGLSLTEVSLEVSFSEKSLVLTGAGEVFGVAFDVLVVARKRASASGWGYGMAFSAGAGDLGGVTGLPGPVETALMGLSPEYIRLSVAQDELMVAEGATLRKGLSLAVFLPLSGGPMGEVLRAAPGELRDQVTSAGGGVAGLTLVADIVSTTELDIFVELAGGVPIGKDVALRAVALAFKITTGSPEMGFLVDLDFTLGSGVSAQDFTASGFIGLSADGLTVGLPLNNPEPWVRPFGLNGVTLLFPLWVEMAISSELRPSSFALVGGLQVAGVTGAVVLSADVADLAKTALIVKMSDFDLKKIVTGIARCSACLGEVGGTLATASIKSLNGSFNPDQVNAVTVTAGGASATIPAGVNLEVVDLNLWNVVKVSYGKFRVTATGFEAVLVADKVNWGPIEVTSADGTAGPSLELVLTESAQRLGINGRASILGQTVAVYLAFSDTSFVGSFLYSLGSSFSVQVALTSTGTPGTGGFSSTLAAALEGDVISAIIAEVTAFLDSLNEAAQSDLDAANRKLASALGNLQNANSDLESSQNRAAFDLKDANENVDFLAMLLDEKDQSCRAKKKRCIRKPWTCGSVPACLGERAAITAAKEAADATLAATVRSTENLNCTAHAKVSAAGQAVAASRDAVSAAEAVTDELESMAQAAGGSLDKVLRIQALSFTGGLTSVYAAVSFTASLRIIDTNIIFGFTADPSFTEITDAIEDKTRTWLRGVYGSRIPDL